MTAQQLGQVSDNIIQPSLRDEEMAVSSAQQANAPLEHLANIISDHALDVYKHEEVAQAQSQAMLDASQGKVGSINNLTNANQVYNHVMAKVAPSILASTGVSQLNGVYQNIVGSPNFNPATAMQDYQKQANQILGEYNKSAIDPQFKGEVNMLLQTHAGQVATKIANKVQDVHKQQFAMSAINTYNDATDNLQDAIADGNYNAAEIHTHILSNIINAGVANGMFTGKEGAEMYRNTTTNAIINGIVANANKTGNYDLPEGFKDTLHAKELTDLQSQLDIARTKANAAQRAQAIQNGYDKQTVVARLVSGQGSSEDIMKAPVGDRSYLIQAQNIGKLYLQAKTDFLSDGENNRIFRSDAFKSKPLPLQNFVKSIYRSDVVASKDDPAVAYGLDKLGDYTQQGVIEKRGVHIISNNLPVPLTKGLLTKDELIHAQNNFAVDPVQEANTLRQSAGRFSQQVLSQVAGKTPMAGVVIPNNQDFLKVTQMYGPEVGRSDKLNVETPIKKALLQNTSPVTVGAVGRTIRALPYLTNKKTSYTLQNAAFRQKFDLVNGGITLKEDTGAFKNANFIKDYSDFLEKQGNSQSQVKEIMSKLTPDLDIEHNAYKIYTLDKAGHRQLISSYLPRSSLERY